MTDSRPLPDGRPQDEGYAEAGPAGAAAGAAGARPDLVGDDTDDDLDRTVVAARSTWNHWALVLPDDTRVELPANDIVIGRRPEARDGAVAVRIPDDTRTLSKSHARMRFNGETWTIEDLGSTNGVALVLGDGREVELVPGEETNATARMIIGTLKVSLRDEGADR